MESQERARSTRIPKRSLLFRIVIPLLLGVLFLLMTVLIGVAVSVLLGMVPWQ
jgi:hypothetical protein